MKTLSCALLVAALAVLETGCMIGDFGMGDRFTEDFHYNYNFAPGGRISVENTNGSIEIAGWDKDSVAISGTKSASSEEALKSIKIEISQGAGSISVRTLLPPVRHGGAGAKYLINLPRKSQLDQITSTNGPLRVEDISGEVRLRTSNGSIHLGNVRGRLWVDTSNGRIEGTNLDGDTVLRTTNGSIHLDRVRGAMEARTTNGSITLSLPADIKATVDAETTHGTVSSDFDELVHRSRSRRHLEGAIGNGGPLIRLLTTNGSIRLRKG